MSNRNLTPEELAERWRVSPRTIQRQRLTGEGPRYLRLSATKVIYPLSAVEEWEAARMAGSVTEEQQREATVAR